MFIEETMQAKRQWSDAIKVLKEIKMLNQESIPSQNIFKTEEDVLSHIKKNWEMYCQQTCAARNIETNFWRVWYQVEIWIYIKKMKSTGK